MPAYCDVVVNRPIVRHRVMPDADYAQERDAQEANPLGVTFSYAIPEDLRQQIALGQLVEVPFRKGTLQAVVVGLSDVPPPDIETRPLASILDPAPVLTPVQIALAHWLSMRYLAHLSSCTWLFLPPGILRPPQTVVEAVRDKIPPPDMEARAQALFLYLRGKEEPTPIDDLEAEPLKILSDIELVRTRKRLAPPRVGPLIDRSLELIASPEEVAAALPGLGHASKQADLLLYLATLDDPLPAVDEVLAAVGCTQGPIRALAERGWVRLAPKRTLVATPLSGPAIDAALAGLTRAPAQRAALTFLRDHPGPVETTQMSASLATLAALEAKGYLRRWTEPATVTLTLDPDEVLDTILELRSATRHAAVLDLLAREEGRVWIGWVYAQTDATLDTLRDLAEAGLLTLDEARRWRDPLSDQSFVLESPPHLTPEQEAVWGVVKRGLRTQDSGNQGSGNQESGNQGIRNQGLGESGISPPRLRRAGRGTQGIRNQGTRQFPTSQFPNLPIFQSSNLPPFCSTASPARVRPKSICGRWRRFCDVARGPSFWCPRLRWRPKPCGGSSPAFRARWPCGTAICHWVNALTPGSECGAANCRWWLGHAAPSLPRCRTWASSWWTRNTNRPTSRRVLPTITPAMSPCNWAG